MLICFAFKLLGISYHISRTSRLFGPFSVYPKQYLQRSIHRLRNSAGNGVISGSICRVQYRFSSSKPALIHRNPVFSTINSDDITHFKEILGEKNVIQDGERLLDANTDWMRKYRGSSKLLLQPRSTEEVQIFPPRV